MTEKIDNKVISMLIEKAEEVIETGKAVSINIHMSQGHVAYSVTESLPGDVIETSISNIPTAKEIFDNNPAFQIIKDMKDDMCEMKEWMKEVKEATNWVKDPNIIKASIKLD